MLLTVTQVARISVGREAIHELSLPRDETVSRNHADLRLVSSPGYVIPFPRKPHPDPLSCRGFALEVEDHSSNGTFLNGVMIPVRSVANNVSACMLTCACR